MFQLNQTWQRCNFLQVVCQVKQLLVSILVPVSVLIWANDKAVLRVHDVVSPQVIHHDCVSLSVLTRKLGPDKAQWLAVKQPCTVENNMIATRALKWLTPHAAS